MTVLTIGLVVICLTSLATAGIVIWWTMDSQGQHSIGAGKSTERALQLMETMTERALQVTEAQIHLTEMLLLGRERPENEPMLPQERPSETSPTPEELSAEMWAELPEQIRENLQREFEEEATWLSHSEQLQPDSSEPEQGWIGEDPSQ